MTQRLSIFKLLVLLVFLISGLLAWNIAAPSRIAFAAADSCTPPSTTYGKDTMSVSVPADGTYTIWTRMQAASASSNSILLNIDNTNCYNVGGDSSIAAGSWTWVDYNDGSVSNVIKVSLSQGTHTFTLTGTDSGVGIDRIEALTDNTCTPTGTGDNCTPAPDTTPPTVSMTAPSNGATVSGSSVTVSANASDNVAVANVQFKLDGTDLGSADTTAPYSYTWDSKSVNNGSHTLSAVATDTSGNVSAVSSVTVTVSNSGPDTTPPTTSISSGPASSTTATTASFSFTGTDNVTPANLLTFQCSLDSGAYSACTSPQAYNGLSVGSHTFSVKATDQAGNVDPSPATQTWTVTAAILGDLDGDGVVTGHDLSILISHFGTNYAPGELDGGNTVEGHDLSILLSNFGK